MSAKCNEREKSVRVWSQPPTDLSPEYKECKEREKESGCGPSCPQTSAQITDGEKCNEREKKSQGVVPAAHRPQPRVQRVQSVMREEENSQDVVSATHRPHKMCFLYSLTTQLFFHLSPFSPLISIHSSGITIVQIKEAG